MKKNRIPREFLGAFKEGHRYATREFIDDDFSHELLKKAKEGDQSAIEALEFYAKFNNEFYKTVFLNDGTDLHSKAEQSERNSARYKRSCDVIRTAKSLHDTDPEDLTINEDHVISLIDFKKEKELSKKQ